MNRNWKGLAGVVALVALAFSFAGAPLAQTTTTVDTRNFEVITVEGNKLVVRDQNGTNEITVPDDFRFTVDGKKMAVSELKAGMKGSATITTTTTVVPVVVTEVREGEVLKASDLSMTVRTADGTRVYKQGQLDAKGIQIFKDGKPVRLADLRKGDKLSATIVTSGPPVVLTEQEVQATLADASAASPAAPAATAAKAEGAAKSAAPAAAASPAQPSGGIGMTWYLLIAVLVIIAVFFFARRRKEP